MKKDDIFKHLNKLELDKNEFIIINDASLVVQDVIDETEYIEMLSSKNYKLKEDIFVLSNMICNKEDTIIINGYHFMNLEKCLEIKRNLNKKEDKKIIEKLDLYLCTKDNKKYEKELYKKGIKYIGGVDEVGRGPLVGPVVACCCVLDEKFELEGLTDSKKLSEKKRDVFYDYIKENALAYGIGIVDADMIDKINIYEATKLAMKEAINKVKENLSLEHVLIDAMPLDLDIPSTSIIKGDIKSISIAAASVLAKVTRDRMMYDLDLKYPQYGYKNHKGYPTKKHIEAINKYGLIDGYRKTYGPVKDVIERVK